jgi:hypothetical protein
VRWREELEEPPFVKRSFVSVGLVNREVEKNRENREKRRSFDSVAV